MNQQKFNPAVASKRRQKDIMKLLMSDYKVTQSKENQGDFIVEFDGPKDTLYQGGQWQIHVLLPDQYPYKSPSIGFNNKIYHPNVDEGSGSVCLDVINQAWSPMYDLINVFEQFLPQLLSYPNPTDPLNPDAASLMLKNEKQYELKVKDYVQKYALKQIPLEKQQSQKSSSNQNPFLKKERKTSSVLMKNSSTTGGSTDDQIEDEEDMQNNFSQKRNRKKSNDNQSENVQYLNNSKDNEFRNSKNQEYQEEEEEDEQVSNISLDNLSELSQLSELELNEDECCY